MINLEQDKAKLIQLLMALESLGSATAIAEFFEKEGIKGARLLACSCPVSKNANRHVRTPRKLNTAKRPRSLSKDASGVLSGTHFNVDLEDDLDFLSGIAEIHRSNLRADACEDDCEHSAPYLRVMPRESYNETGEPYELDFCRNRYEGV